jgi:hypothetical protein
MQNQQREAAHTKQRGQLPKETHKKDDVMKKCTGAEKCIRSLKMTPDPRSRNHSPPSQETPVSTHFLQTALLFARGVLMFLPYVPTPTHVFHAIQSTF